MLRGIAHAEGLSEGRDGSRSIYVKRYVVRSPAPDDDLRRSKTSTHISNAVETADEHHYLDSILFVFIFV